MSNEALQPIVSQILKSQAQLAPNARDVAPKNRFLVIRGKHNTLRWILPVNPKEGLAGLQFWEPYDLASRIKWNTILTAYKLGQLHHLPGVQTIGVEHVDFKQWSHLTGREDQTTYTPVVYLAEPSPRQKAVVFLVNPTSQECQFVGKFPLGTIAGRKINHEAEMLIHVAEYHAGIAPSLCHQNPLNGTSLQTTQTFQGTGRALTTQHIEWLLQLRSGKRISLLAEAHQLVQRFTILDTLLDPIQRWAIAQCERLNAHPMEVPMVIQHGDFAPWNLKRLQDGALFAVDWEEGKIEGLPLYDLVHFCFLQNYLRGQNLNIVPTLLKSLPVQTYMQALHLSPDYLRWVFRYFLLDYLCRQLEERDEAKAQQFYLAIQPILAEAD